MTISTNTFPHQYIASSGQTVFAYQSKVFGKNDIKVIVTDTNNVESLKTVDLDYSVSGLGNDAGGNITFTTGVTLNYIVTISRNEPFTQEIDYVEGDDFPAVAHEEGLDRSVLRDQTLNNLIVRGLRFSEGSNITGISTELTLGEVKGKALYFDATTGEPIGFDISALSTIPTLNNETLTGDGTASYTLSFTPASENAIDIYIEGLFIEPSEYTLSGAVITFDTTVDVGDVIEVNELGAALSVTVPNGHINTARLADGAVTPIKVAYIDGIYLDVNGNPMIQYTDNADAVNYVSVANAATTGAPSITAVGSDTNIDLNLQPKGSGQVILDNLTFPAADGVAGQVLKTNGSGSLSFANAIDKYVSSDTSYTDGTAVTFTHGLGDAPTLVSVDLVCVTTEGGYVTGDVIKNVGLVGNETSGAGTNRACVAYVENANTTEVKVRVGSQSMSLGHKTTGTLFTATAANWKLRVTAIKI